MDNKYDVIVVGGGHAGIEACLSSARRGFKTLLITGNIKRIGAMPCNPSIGGPAKGIVVREIDALGGQMAKTTDETLLQIKILNSSRGPAVWALRAQSDKIKYSQYMQKVILNCENLVVKEALVLKLITKDKECLGVETTNNKLFYAKKTILTTGTYMESLTFQGKTTKKEGPDGEKRAEGLSGNLIDLGFETFRLKTGTPPRIDKDSINYDNMTIEPGTKQNLSFSYNFKNFLPYEKQDVCWLIHSNSEIKKLVEKNIHKSSMFKKSLIVSGPRYCPSFEDKVYKFKDKERHQIFLEPESKDLNTIYLQGFSTSMPIDVQEKMVHLLPGLENAKILKYAYAIEYDAIKPTQLKHTLETKIIKNLYTAGQINGTSGYEEAACQGLMAGINATLAIENKEPFILKRNEAYIGVLIDDLILKGTNEPYRLLTSRAEYRLLLRNDNAEKRLMKYGYQYNLIDEYTWNHFNKNLNIQKDVWEKLEKTRIKPNSEMAKDLIANNMQPIYKGVSIFELIKRPEITIDFIDKHLDFFRNITFNQKQSIFIEIRLEGYLAKEEMLVKRFQKMENQLIPKDIDYNNLPNLSLEAIEKLNKIKPDTIGQMSRISGLKPSDVQTLIYFIRKIYI